MQHLRLLLSEERPCTCYKRGLLLRRRRGSWSQRNIGIGRIICNYDGPHNCRRTGNDDPFSWRTCRKWSSGGPSAALSCRMYGNTYKTKGSPDQRNRWQSRNILRWLYEGTRWISSLLILPRSTPPPTFLANFLLASFQSISMNRRQSGSLRIHFLHFPPPPTSHCPLLHRLLGL